MKTLAAVIVLGIGVSAVAEKDRPEASMTVFVKAAEVKERKKVDKATEKALKKARDTAKKARKSLEKQIKKAHGKKREKWPPEQEEEYFRAEEAEAIANAEYEYRKIEPEKIDDSVEDLVESAQGKGIAGEKDRVILVGSPAEAELIVEVRARRGKKAFGAVVPSMCYVLFSVGPGEKLTAERFASIPSDYRPRKGWVWRLRAPKADDPAFLFESYNGGASSIGCHGAAANAAAAGVEKFIEDNHALLTGTQTEEGSR